MTGSFVSSNFSITSNFSAMKFPVKIIALPLILLFSFSILYGQQNALKLNLPYNQNWSGNYERVINTKTTFLVEFQHWNRHTSHATTLSLFGITETDSRQVTISGYRTEIMLRRFAKSAMNGWFMEGGLYAGKHQVNVVDQNSTVNPYALFLFNFDELYQEETKTTHYSDVRVGGLKIGGGFDKHFGHFSVEVSTGLNMNLFNNQNVRPSLPLKSASPYLRIGMGVAF